MGDGKLTRRDFVKAATAAALSVPTILVNSQPKTFRVALIGCGGRGRGAVRDITKQPNYWALKFGW
jgi:hypothetical protein